MSIKDDLIGSKGGSSTFRNRPDNLRSTDTFEALIGLCSGRIKGLAPGGLQNLMVDDVPIEDGSGNTTLTDFNAILFDGDPTILQPIQLQLGGSSGAQNVNLPLNNANQGTGTGTPGDWRYGTVPQGGVDYIDLRFIISGLFRQDKKGIYDATASIEIELQASGSSQWINPLASVAAPTYNKNGIKLAGYSGVSLYVMGAMYADANTWYDPAPGFLQVTGKTSQAYVKELRVAVPNTGNYANKTWQVRARLRERDSYTNDQDQESRSIQWESIAGVSMAPIGNREEWRGLAYLHVNGKASDQLSGVPTITGIYDLSTVRVPPASVWNAETRTYTGTTWDGATEEVQWTQCPAFQIKDLVEDGVSGISALVPGSTLNKWDALEASKWYAQRVSDGQGGTQPRYSMNYLLDSALSVNDLMQYVAGAVGSYAWDEGDGKWRLVVEKPENATALFTKENIVGEFNYAHTDVDTRYNDMIGVYRSEARGFDEDRVRVFDQAHIDNFGRRATSVALVGCTNRQEALRRIKIRQLTSLNETRQVSFVTNRQGNMVQPFSVILVADGDLAGDTSIRTTGRLVAKSGTNLTVRDTMRLELGISYKIHVTIPNPDYNPASAAQPGSADWRKPTITITRNVTNAAGARGDVTLIQIDAALPANTPVNAPIAFEAVGLPTLPKQYRVLEVENQDEEMVSISAIEIYTNKWNESDSVNEADILAQRPNKTIPAPTIPETGMFSVKTYEAEFQTKRVLTTTWDRPGSIWIDGFKVEFNLNNGPWQTLTENTQDNYVELQQPQNGLYTFRISTVDRRGGYSTPLISAYQLEDTAADYAPVHTRGLLRDRPTAGGREGDKYTTTDQSPNLTFIWSKGQWYDESTFVKDATDIKYIDPATGQETVPVQSLMPGQAGADVTGDHTSKDTNAVAGRPASQIVYDISQLTTDVTDLYAALGSSQGAEQYAEAAEQYAKDAKTAQEASQAARDVANQAQQLASGSATTATNAKNDAVSAFNAADAARALTLGYRDQASQAKTDAQSAQNAASASASASQTSATNASGFASTASGQATIATQKATDAGTSASNASASATTASTQAGNASTSASNAATSATNALGSSNSASTSAGVAATNAAAANLSAAKLFPDRYDSTAGQYFLGSSVGDPKTSVGIDSNATVTGYGPVYQTTLAANGRYDFAPRAVLSATPGRIYKVEAEFQATAFTGAPNVYLTWRSLNSAYASIGTGQGTGANPSVVVNGNVQTLTTYVSDVAQSALAVSSWPTGSIFMRPYIQAQNTASSTMTIQFRRITVTDVTERFAAQASATAAATSASSASTSQSAAGTSATAANTSATNASTSAGQASTSASNASTSATNALGSANTATTQAGVAATSATGARLSLAATFPENLNGDITTDSSVIGATTGMIPLNVRNPTWVVDNNSAIMPIKTVYTFSLIAPVQLVSGQIYEVVCDVENVSTTAGNTRFYYTLLNSDLTWFGTDATSANWTTLQPSDRVTVRRRFGVGISAGTDTTVIASGPQYLRITQQLNRIATGSAGDPNVQMKVRALYVRNVTSEVNALNSANAAAGSASTASASQTAAGQSASAAQASAATASTKASEASASSASAATSESNALGSKNAAASSASVAATARDDAVTAKNAAGTSATAASNSASAASASKDAAGSSASAAKTSETNAGTSAGTASTKASEASTSATNALGSANTATTQASVAASSRDAAALSAAATLPNNFVDPTQWVAERTASGGSVSYSAGVFKSTGPNGIYTRGFLPLSSERKYRFTMRHRLTNANGGTVAAYLGFESRDANGVVSVISLTNGRAWLVSAQPVTVAEGWKIATIDVTGETLLSIAPGAVGIHAAGLVNWNVAGAVAEISLLSLTDVTSELAASGSATAAAGSASLASTKADAAGVSASAALASQTAANTSAGNASTSASQASTSASNALGSANSAVAASGVAANAQTAAISAASSTLPANFDGSDNYWSRADRSTDTAATSYWELRGTEYWWTGTVPGSRYTSVVATGNKAAVVGRKYQTSVEVSAWANGGVVTIAPGMVINRGGSLVTFEAAQTLTVPTSGQFVTVLGAIYTAQTGDRSISPRATVTGGNYYVRNVTFYDVTEREASSSSATAAATSASSAAASKSGADQSASAASASATNAGTSAGQASTSAGQASTSASNALGSANSASASQQLAASNASTAGQAKTDAQNFASAASGSASTATTKANEAGQSASAANQSRIDAQTAQGAAASSASAANTSAVNAGASASSAQTSAMISSSYSSSSSGVNDKFANWPDAGTNPVGWTQWAADNAYRIDRGAGGSGSAYYAKTTTTGTASGNSGFSQTITLGAGKWIISATAYLESGSWQGSGAVLGGVGSSINFATEADNAGVLSTTQANQMRTWSKIVDVGNGAVTLHAMHNWTSFGATPAKVMRWYQVFARPANAAEIAGNKALADGAANTASISSLQQTVTNALGSLGTRTDTLEAKALAQPTTHIVRARGAAGVQTGGAPGLFTSTGVRIGISEGRSYSVFVKNAADDNWFSINFDLVGNSAAVSDMTNLLNGINRNQIVVITTFDDPSANRLAPGLVAAMQRVGSGPLFQSPTFRYRGAYILVGYAGAGYGGGTEWYAGSSDSSEDAYLDKTFTRAGNSLNVGNSAAAAVRDVTARVTTTEAVLSTVQGRTEAYSQKVVQAGMGSAFVTMMAKDDNGNYTSNVGIGAATIALYNQTSGGFKLAMQLSGGNALFTGSLNVGATIRLGSGDGWAVALQQRDFSVGDGETLTYGADLGNRPDFTIGNGGMAALNAGEVYDVRMTDVTGTSAKLYAKIVTSGTTTTYGSSNPARSGSGPTFQATNNGQPNATNGQYVVSATMDAASYPSAEDDGGAQRFRINSVGYIDVWALISGAWAKIQTIATTFAGRYSTGGEKNYTYLFNSIVVTAGTSATALGLTASSVSDGRIIDIGMSNYTWGVQGTSNARSALPNGSKTTVTVRPK